MKWTVIRNNYIIGIVDSSYHTKESIELLLKYHNISFDQVVAFPKSSDVTVGDDIRSYNASGDRLSVHEIALSVKGEGISPGETVVLTDEGWKVVPNYAGKLYVSGDTISTITKFDESYDLDNIFNSYKEIMTLSLHGAKLIAKRVVKAKADAMRKEPVPFKGTLWNISQELVERLRNIEILDIKDSPWVIADCDGVVHKLTSEEARELITAYIIRNESINQWEDAMIQTRIEPALRPGEVLAIMESQNLRKAMEEYNG